MKQILTLIIATLILPLLTSVGSAQDSYRIKSGDILRVEVEEDASINRDVLVAPDGRISIPQAGTIKASGRSIEQIKADVTSKLAPNFNSGPSVYVSISRLAERTAGPATGRTIDVYIMGEVATPGKISIDSGTRLLQFLGEVGGFSKFASLKRIQLRRIDASGKERIYPVNYNDIVAGKSSIGSTTLADGDIIIVPQRKLFE